MDNFVTIFFLKYTIKALASVRPKNKNTLIHKSDKGHPVTIFDKAHYLGKMEKLLNDTRKF